MRNGLNIAASSELVHEIQVVGEEALLCFRARVAPLGPRLLQAEIAPMDGGTIRVVRDFRFLTGQPGPGSADAIPYQEQLLAALAGCVLVTFVQGCSARGITLTRAAVSAEGRMGADSAGRPSVGEIACEYDVDCDGKPEALIEIARYASCLSPNQRMFIERGTVRIRADGDGMRPFVLEEMAKGPDAMAAASRHARVEWRYGAQLSWQLNGREHLLDQPKQYLGLDSGPNPLEYFLAASAAEMVDQVRREGAQRGIELPELTVLTAGSVDLRGITNLEENAPVRMYDIGHTLAFNRALDADEAASIARAAASSCIAHALVCREQVLNVTVKSRAEKLASFRSDATMLKEYLAELHSRKQRASID